MSDKKDVIVAMVLFALFDLVLALLCLEQG